jgi:protein required for attachment to host cells
VKYLIDTIQSQVTLVNSHEDGGHEFIPATEISRRALHGRDPEPIPIDRNVFEIGLSKFHLGGSVHMSHFSEIILIAQSSKRGALRQSSEKRLDEQASPSCSKNLFHHLNSRRPTISFEKQHIDRHSRGCLLLHTSGSAVKVVSCFSHREREEHRLTLTIPEEPLPTSICLLCSPPLYGKY